MQVWDSHFAVHCPHSAVRRIGMIWLVSPATRLGPRSLILGGIAAAADAAATATNFDTAAPASHRPLRRPNPAPGVAPPPLPPSLLQMRRALSLKTPKSVRFADEVSVKTFKREGGEMAKDAVSEGTKADTKKTDTFCRREWMSNPNFARQTKKFSKKADPGKTKALLKHFTVHPTYHRPCFHAQNAYVAHGTNKGRQLGDKRPLERWKLSKTQKDVNFISTSRNTILLCDAPFLWFLSSKLKLSGGKTHGESKAELLMVNDLANFKFMVNRVQNRNRQPEMSSLDELYKYGIFDVWVLRGTAYFSRRHLVWPRALYHATHPLTFLPYL